MGVSKRLKEINPNLEIIVIEPDESPTMSGGKPGLHKIQGIGDGSKFLADINIIDRIEKPPWHYSLMELIEIYEEVKN